MKTRTWIRCTVVSLTIAAVTAAGARAAGPSLSQRADYNNSIAALMGGVVRIKEANAASLKTAGDFVRQLVSVQQLQEQVRAARMDNDLKRAQHFHAMRKLHADYRKAHPRGRPDAKTLQEIARRGVPAKAASAMITHETAALRWPAVLNRPAFQQKRAELQRLWDQRTAADSGAGSRNCHQIQQAVAELQAQLRQQVRSFNPMDYLAAKKFLEGLAHQARIPASAPAIAAVASNN